MTAYWSQPRYTTDTENITSCASNVYPCPVHHVRRVDVAVATPDLEGMKVARREAYWKEYVRSVEVPRKMRTVLVVSRPEFHARSNPR